MWFYWLVLVGMLIERSLSCPVSCSCKWKNGKQTVICSGKSLTDIPDGLDPGTQVLDFSGNFLSNLRRELFSNKQLINLQRIYLSNCQIKIINEKTFKGLSNLVELDLSRNLLETVPTSSFVDCPSLMRLTLSSNPLTVLKRLAFNHLSYLSTLELDKCKIVETEDGAFQGLHSLEWLLLEDNALRTIRGELPPSLKGVELRGNPWECDCHIKELHVWLGRFNVPISEEPTCSGPPRLASRVIKSIPVSELACLPDVSPTTFYLELAEGKNVSLQCHVHSIPEASVSWWFRGQILQNNTIVSPGIHLIYFVEEGAENKRSELFIYNANSEDNGTFICNAENAAGTSQSNFTIKIIIKEDPIVIIVEFPFECLLAAAIGAVVLALLIISGIIISILRCKQQKQPLPGKTEEDTNPKPTPTDDTLYVCEDHPVANHQSSTLLFQDQNPDLINHRWLDSEGYPLDYGLPKLPTNYYRTLPSRPKRQSLQRARYSQEAEFLAYDHYHTDVRYTADGYPLPSNDGAPCCSIQWPVCVPANLHMVNNNPNEMVYEPPAGIIKRCVGAQTEDEKIDSNEAGNEAMTESPDEGYEGEPAVV